MSGSDGAGEGEGATRDTASAGRKVGGGTASAAASATRGFGAETRSAGTGLDAASDGSPGVGATTAEHADRRAHAVAVRTREFTTPWC